MSSIHTCTYMNMEWDCMCTWNICTVCVYTHVYMRMWNSIQSHSTHYVHVCCLGKYTCSPNPTYTHIQYCSTYTYTPNRHTHICTRTVHIHVLHLHACYRCAYRYVHVCTHVYAHSYSTYRYTCTYTCSSISHTSTVRTVREQSHFT